MSLSESDRAKKTEVFLGIGSNIDREKSIASALNLLQTEFGELLISPTFESEAIGFCGDNFYNLVVAFTTELSLPKIIEIYREIEDVSGRDRNDPKFSARTLDIDPLLYGGLICEQPVMLPREEILQNAYVLWPLSIIAPDKLHPVTGLSYSEHWQSYEKQQRLWQIETVW